MEREALIKVGSAARKLENNSIKLLYENDSQSLLWPPEFTTGKTEKT